MEELKITVECEEQLGILRLLFFILMLNIVVARPLKYFVLC